MHDDIKSMLILFQHVLLYKTVFYCKLVSEKYVHTHVIK